MKLLYWYSQAVKEDPITIEFCSILEVKQADNETTVHPNINSMKESFQKTKFSIVQAFNPLRSL